MVEYLFISSVMNGIWWQEFLNYAVEMDSDAVIYAPILIKNNSDVSELIGCSVYFIKICELVQTLKISVELQPWK
jgi:hypothetical protein